MVRNVLIATAIFSFYVSAPAVGQTPASGTGLASTKYCADHPNDSCCSEQAKKVAACFYAWREGGPGQPPPVAAGMSRPDVLDFIQKNGPDSYRSMIMNDGNAMKSQ